MEARAGAGMSLVALVSLRRRETSPLRLLTDSVPRKQYLTTRQLSISNNQCQLLDARPPPSFVKLNSKVDKLIVAAITVEQSIPDGKRNSQLENLLTPKIYERRSSGPLADFHHFILVCL
jgi:hypothetical protein